MTNYNQEQIVFHKPWFKRNQKWLLFLANSFIGRYILRINGDRSSVGKNKIIKIEPHAITWVNKDGTRSTEFRTHAKFAKRLYFAFYPMWQLMHLWDMQIANILFPKLNLGFDTLTIYPDANPEVNTVDGYVSREVTSETWSTIKAGAGTNAYPSNGNIAVGYVTANNATSNRFSEVYRGVMLFNTSSVGANNSLVSAVLSLHGEGTGFTVQDIIGAGGISTYIVASTPASNTNLVSSDYGQVGDDFRSSAKTQGSISDTAYNAYTLNASGLSILNKSGISKYGLRFAQDISGTTPPWASFSSLDVISYQSADYTGTSNDPKLVVTYNVEAYITNSVDFTIGASIPLTISNVNNRYVKSQLYVNGSLIRTDLLGKVTSATITPSSTDISNMYAQVPSATSTTMYFRVTTWSDSGYTSQIGGNRDETGTAYVDTIANAPVFTTYTVANVDKTINVTDAYSNIVISSSTSTLLGSDARMIEDYSKLRATILTGNKATPVNSATMSKYRFIDGIQQIEAAYSSGGTVTLDIDNANSISTKVLAIDSRNLSTEVDVAMSLIANYTELSLFNMALARDNSVDALTTLTFAGQFWKKYFSSNTTSNPGTGVLNAITTHYRYKNTSNSWTTQNGTFTVTIASPGVITKSSHGLATGDVVYLTTTIALPTGLSANTVYYVIKIDANTFKLATSSANATAGTAINTSGTQSGVHTLNIGSPWTSITASSDSAGVISYSAHIDGDLGASGFDTAKSFSIQVRSYDKLSVAISELILPAGTPLLHWHRGSSTDTGVSILKKYDSTEGGSFQVDGKSIMKMFWTGWIQDDETWVYVSVDDPTGIVKITGKDLTTKYSAGMRIKFTCNALAIKGIITNVALSGSDTQITFLHEINPSNSLALSLLTNNTITLNYFSPFEAPYGFPMDPSKWTVYVVNTSDTRTAAPTINTWNNDLSIVVPIGVWIPRWSGILMATRASTSVAQVKETLSTANNSEVDTQFTIRGIGQYAVNPNTVNTNIAYVGHKIIAPTSKTTYYLNHHDTNLTETNVGLRGDISPSIISMLCGYL